VGVAVAVGAKVWVEVAVGNGVGDGEGDGVAVGGMAVAVRVAVRLGRLIAVGTLVAAKVLWAMGGLEQACVIPADARIHSPASHQCLP